MSQSESRSAATTLIIEHRKNSPVLTRGHFAAMRSWIQGLPVDLIASRYLGHSSEDYELPDIRILKAALAEIRTALIERAKMLNQPFLAAALEKDYSKSELLNKRAVQAVHDIERLGAPKPALDHLVEHWFSPPFAKRLKAVSIYTIRDLHRFCDNHGKAYWRRIPRIGEVAGIALINWLQKYEAPLGIKVADHTTGQNTQLALPTDRAVTLIHPGIVVVPPLEAMLLPPWLDGSEGANRNRLDPSSLVATNDYQAILAFLNRHPTGSLTWKAYRKECERFLAWAIIERGKSLSALKMEDCTAYREFLKDPQPEDRWRSKKGSKKLSRSLPGWRPFEGKLAATSVNHAIRILNKLGNFLVNSRYWYSNPWFDVPKAKVDERIKAKEKALSKELWEAFYEWLEKESQDPAAVQHRAAAAAILLMRDSGLRISEAASADRSKAVSIDEEGDVWGELEILGKGTRYRDVPISKRTAEAFRRHWQDRGEDFDKSMAGPLIAPIQRSNTKRSTSKQDRGERGYSASGIHHLVVKASKRFQAALTDEQQVYSEKAKRIRAHALRHTFGRHAVDADVKLDVVSKILGHASLKTTTIYTDPEKKRRIKEIRKLYKT